MGTVLVESVSYIPPRKPTANIKRFFHLDVLKNTIYSHESSFDIFLTHIGIAKKCGRESDAKNNNDQKNIFHIVSIVYQKLFIILEVTNRGSGEIYLSNRIQDHYQNLSAAFPWSDLEILKVLPDSKPVYHFPKL